MAYATVTEWQDSDFAPTPFPADAEKRLSRASRVVDEMLLTAVYDVDDTGMPTDVDVIEALREATCAQAEYAGAIGDSKSVGAAQYHSMQIGSVNLTRGYNSGGSSAPGRYSPAAWATLQKAGLTGQPPQTGW